MRLILLPLLSLVIAATFLVPCHRARAQGPKIEAPEGPEQKQGRDIDLPYSEIRLPLGRPHNFVFSPDGAKIAIGLGAKVVLINMSAQKELVRLQLPHADTWHRLVFSSDAKTLLWIGQQDRTVRQFNVNSGKQVREFQPPADGSVRCVTRDGTRIVYADRSGALAVYDVENNKPIVRIEEPPSYYAEFTPDGKRLAVRDADNRLCFFDAQTGKLVQALREADPRREASGFEFVAFAPDGALAATWGRKNFLDIWDLKTGKCLRSIQTRHWYHGGQFSRDGQSILCWNSSNEAVLHNILLARVVHRFVSPRPYSASLTPDEKKIVILSDSTVRADYQFSLFICDLPAQFLAPSAARGIDDVEPSGLWVELKSDNELRYQLAVKALRSAPKQAVDAIRKALPPVAEAKQKQVDTWIAELDEDSSQRREAAMQNLHEVAHEFSPLLLARHKTAGPGEVRNRLTFVLGQMNGERTPLTLVRETRAVELLEHLATPDAWQLLSDLAGGASQARLTVEARAALARKKN